MCTLWNVFVIVVYCVSMRTKKNRKKSSIGVDVLKGLEEQRRKSELLKRSVMECEEKKPKEINGFYYDTERKRYFPLEMKKEEKKERIELVHRSLNVVNLVLRMKEGEKDEAWLKSLKSLNFEKRVWKRMDGISEGSIHGLYLNGEWLWLGYSGCIVRYNRKNGRMELVRECMGGECVCLSEGICVLNRMNESRVYDVLNGKEWICSEEIWSGCHCVLEGKEGWMICGKALYMEFENVRKRIEYPRGHVCSVITRECICGFRNGAILEWKNGWKRICSLEGCVKRLVYRGEYLCGCDVFGNGVICLRVEEHWSCIRVPVYDIQDICILDDYVMCLKKNGMIVCVDGSGIVLKEMCMDLRGKWMCGDKNACVIVNEKGNMMWSS